MRFGDFQYEPDQRRLTKAGEPVDLSGRYLDALGLLLAKPGDLVTKDRFMDEVWRGAPVTDEALTQAIRALRKALGDEAAKPRFIETVPKHGYRFIAAVEGSDRSEHDAGAVLSMLVAGASGGAVAGMMGGFAYAMMGGGAALLVLVLLTGVLGALGGAGIGIGIGIARALAGRRLMADVLGGAAGGLIVGAIARLFGIDAFTLLVGEAPMAMTGALEGVMLGLAVGLVVGTEPATRRRALGLGALAGGVAGVIIGISGGRLMAGSLALLDTTFPDAALDIAIAPPFPGGSLVMIGITAIEAATFVALTVAALSSVEKRPPSA